jgi:hypothetical protein
MNPVRDIYQRKIYALTRMNLARARFNRSINEVDRAQALRWVNAWLAVTGLRQFKLGSNSRKISFRTAKDKY